MKKAKIIDKKTQCVGRVSHPQIWESLQCSRAGKVQRKGEWYCTVHDPVRIEAKQKERSAKFDAKWASIDAADKRERDTKRVGKQLSKRILVGECHCSCASCTDAILLARKYLELSQESANKKGGRRDD